MLRNMSIAGFVLILLFMLLLSGGPISVKAESVKPTPLQLTDMNFINGKIGWTTSRTAKGSDIWKTKDGGKTWTKQSTLDLQIGKIGFSGASEGWLVGKSGCREVKGDVLCSGLQIKHTTDGGAHWSVQWSAKADQVNLYQQPDNLYVVNSKQVYAIVADQYMLATTNGGKTWKRVSFGIGKFLPDTASFNKDGKHGWVLGRAGKGCSATERQALEKCAITVLRTSDGGLHWKTQWAPEDSGYLANIGISFSDLNHGNMLIYDMSMLQSTLYSTADGGKSWKKKTEMRGGRPYTVGLQFVSGGAGFIPLSTGAGPIAGGLLSTKDGGQTFVNIGPADQELSFEQIQFMSGKEGWARMFNFGQGDYLLYTNDAGAHWKRVEVGGKRA